MSLYFHARMFTFRFVVVKLKDEKLMLGRADVAKRTILEVKNRSIKFECSSFVKTGRRWESKQTCISFVLDMCVSKVQSDTAPRIQRVH